MLFPTTLARHALCTLLATALFAGPVHAADEPDKYYQVELIVFAPVKSRAAGEEVWARANRDPLPDDDDSEIAGDGAPGASRAVTPAANGSGVRLTPLSKSEFQMGTEERRLNNSRDYKVLLHTGWRQRGVGPGQAVAFPIRYFLDGGPQEPLPAAAPAPRPGAAMAAESSGDAAVGGPSYTPAPTAQPPRARLEGDVRLVLSRYLHLEPDLRYFTGETIQPVQEEGTDSAFYSMTLQPVVYRLEQSRRMRSGELHYFDHPAFGILARVTPYDPSKPPAQAALRKATSGG